MMYAIKNIIISAKNDRKIFIVFLICEFAAAFILFLSFGTYQNFKLVENESYNKSDLRIGFGELVEKTGEGDEVYYTCDGSVTNGEVKKVLSLLSKSTLKEIETIMYIAATSDQTYAPDSEDIPLEIFFRLEYSQKENRYVPYDIAFNNTPSLYGRSISLNEYNNGIKSIMLPYYYPSEFVGQLMNINGETYKVIGVDLIDDYATIPYINSPDSLSGVTNISFYPKNVLSKNAYDDIVSSLRKVFGDYAFIPKIDTIDNRLPFYNSIMFLSIALTCLAAITLALLFKYILSTRNKFISVLRICGYTNFKVRRIFISEVMITSIFNFLLAALVYFGFAADKLRNSIIYIDIVYNLKNVIIMSAIYFACIYIVLNIMIISVLSKSPNAQIKQGGF